MSAEGVGVLLRRFVALCQRECEISPHNYPFNRLPSEWLRLSEDLTTLLHSCPPSRLAILSFVHPVIVGYLHSISNKPVDISSPLKRKSLPSATPVETFILEVLSAALEVCKWEASAQYQSNSFTAELCTFALGLLAPMRSPAYCNSECSMKRKLRNHGGPGPSSGLIQKRFKGTPSGLANASEDSVSEVDDLSGNESSASRNYESDSDALVVIEDDLQEHVKTGEKETDIAPDLHPNKFNLALLGKIFAYSEVVKQLLRIVFTCMVSQRYSTAASVERLVLCAVPAEVRCSSLSIYTPSHAMDRTACVPHWCIKWLIKQVADAVGQNSCNQSIIDRFCRHLLDVCLRGPHRNPGIEYSRFWAITGLANLVYVGIYFPYQLHSSLTSWLEEKFSELDKATPLTSNLIHVLISLIVLSPRDPSNLDVLPQRNRPRPSALSVARGFLSHDFHTTFPCSHAREFVSICTSMRQIALKTACHFLTRLLGDYKAMESVILKLLKGIPNGPYQDLEDAVVDGICSVSEDCALQCTNLLIAIHSDAPSFSKASTVSQGILSKILSRLESFMFYKERNRLSEVPSFLTSDVKAEDNKLMQMFMEKGYSFAGLLLTIIFSYSRSDELSQQFFKRIVLWNVGDTKYQVNKSACPLLHFFSLLSEWIGLNRADSSTTRKFLKGCLEDVLDTITKLCSWVERKKALVNILWLLKREGAFLKSEDGVLREAWLNNTVNVALPKLTDLLLVMVEEPGELAAFDVALRIFEEIDLNFRGFSRSPADSIVIGRMLASISAVLLRKVDETTFKTRENILGPYKRVLTLLEALSNSNKLIRSSALVHLAQAACKRYVPKERFLIFEPSVVSTLQDSAHSTSDLLIDNPPSELTNKVTVTKGQLIRRNPSVANSAKGDGKDDIHSSEYKPSTALWVHLVRRLLMTSEIEEFDYEKQLCFGGTLEDCILPHGMQLRQTDFVKLSPPSLRGSKDIPESQLQQQNPDQYDLGYHWFQLRQTYLHIRTPPKVQPNAKVVINEPYEPDLDRIMALLRVFVSEWRDGRPTNSERVLWAFLDLLLSPPSDKANLKDSSPFPAPRLILGLLLGLEAAWNSPLAPQVPLPTFENEKEVQSTLGAFPIPGFPDLAKRRARMMAVNNGHRGVDTNSKLYKATEFLVTRLAQYPYIPPSKKDAPEHKLPPPPIEHLLRLLTPREMKFFINDIRNRIRDCVADKDGATNGFFTITPEILCAITESHIMEEGIPELFPRLLTQYTSPLPHPAVEKITEQLEKILSMEEVSVNEAPAIRITSDGEIEEENELDKTIDLEESCDMSMSQ
ncbi:unnamed protein product [Rodentolepis nana]|uniref:Non-specific serine/threonine protein kinase n=1 Tax=Rodentolepis nana TaxID=102285 RepID=A0A0R3TLL7_RODNA|nr:unnamed protein product [Rodentolepis nana]